MGIRVLDPYTTPQGIEVSNVYVSFAANPVYVYPQVEGNTKTYSLQCQANLFVDQTCREGGKSAFETRQIYTSGHPSASTLYANLYAELQTAFPNNESC